MTLVFAGLTDGEHDTSPARPTGACRVFVVGALEYTLILWITGLRLEYVHSENPTSYGLFEER
jgi:hypothetical protein